MRKIIYVVGTSLDRYIDGSLDFLRLRPSNYSMGLFFKTIDVGLMGRKTYEAGVRMAGGSLRAMACAATFSPGGCPVSLSTAARLLKVVPWRAFVATPHPSHRQHSSLRQQVYPPAPATAARITGTLIS